MKRQGIFIFKIIFFLTVFFNMGTDAQACLIVQQDRQEITFFGESDENIFNPGNDSLNEDQISQLYSITLVTEPHLKTYFSQNCHKAKKISYSFWQPPKIF
jgi:hypothetical protein